MKLLKDLPVGSKIKFGKYRRKTESPENMTWFVVGNNLVDAYTDSTGEIPTAKYTADTVTIQSEFIYDELQSTPYDFIGYNGWGSGIPDYDYSTRSYMGYYTSPFRVWLNSFNKVWMMDIVEARYASIKKSFVNPNSYVIKQIPNAPKDSSRKTSGKAFVFTEYQDYYGFLSQFSDNEKSAILRTHLKGKNIVPYVENGALYTPVVDYDMYDYAFLPSCLDGADVSGIDDSLLKAYYGNDKTFKNATSKLHKLSLKYSLGCINKMKTDGRYLLSDYLGYETYDKYLQSNVYQQIQSRTTPSTVPDPVMLPLIQTIATKNNLTNIRYKVMSSPDTQYGSVSYYDYMVQTKNSNVGMTQSAYYPKNTETVSPLMTLKGNVQVSDEPDDDGYYTVSDAESSGTLTTIIHSEFISGNLGDVYLEWNPISNAVYKVRVAYDDEEPVTPSLYKYIYEGFDNYTRHNIPYGYDDTYKRVKYEVTAYNATGAVIGSSISTGWGDVQDSLNPTVTVNINGETFTATNTTNTYTLNNDMQSNATLLLSAISNCSAGTYNISYSVTYKKSATDEGTTSDTFTVNNVSDYSSSDLTTNIRNIITRTYNDGTITINVSSGSPAKTTTIYIKYHRTIDTAIIETVNPVCNVLDMPRRIQFTLAGFSVPSGAEFKMYTCNNGYDDEPTWEECSQTVLAKRVYNFTNKTKTSEVWGIRYKIIMYNPTTNTSRCKLRKVSGTWD